MTSDDRLADILAASPQRPLEPVERRRRPEADQDLATFRGQVYRRVGVEPWTRKSDGAPTTISHWKANCLACLREYECTTPDQGKTFRPPLRCPECRSARRRGWRLTVKETDPAEISPTLPDGRPIAPVEAYDAMARK